MIYRLPSYKDCSYHKKTVVIDRRIFILGIDILVVRRRIDIDMAPIVHFITGISLGEKFGPDWLHELMVLMGLCVYIYRRVA